VIADDGLPVPTVDEAVASLKATGFSVTVSKLTANEANKSLASVERLLYAIADTKHERTDPVIALGGGVVGDIAGFAAAIYRRGVPVIQCPTTLLAMVDAAVGGKTGVNLPLRGLLAKNLIGAFWQPSLVVADVRTLESLPERHLRAGLAECVKHGLISSGLGASSPGHDPDLFRWTSDAAIKVRMGDSQLRQELVARNVRVKASVVAGDEREEAPSAAGGRVLLNLGHTFGHAIETIEHLTPDGKPESAPLQHGEAVAYGLVAAAETARFLRLISEHDAQLVRVAIERLGLESRLVGLPSNEALVARMMHDKKVSGGKLRLVLPDSLGSARVVDDPPLEAVHAGLDAIRAGARHRA
jgi:3-dehydroquinate synthase